MIKAGHTYEISEWKTLSQQPKPPTDAAGQQTDFPMINWIPTEYDLKSATITVKVKASVAINGEVRRIRLGSLIDEVPTDKINDYYKIWFHYRHLESGLGVPSDSFWSESCVPVAEDSELITMTAELPVVSESGTKLGNLFKNPSPKDDLSFNCQYYVGQPRYYDETVKSSDRWTYAGSCHGIWLTVKYDLPNSMARYNGTEWERCLVNRYDGTKWEQCLHFYYDGTKWIPCSSL